MPTNENSWAIRNHQQIGNCWNYTRFSILFSNPIKSILLTWKNSWARRNHWHLEKCSYFIKPKQKNDSPKIEPKASTPDKMGTLSHRKIENVDISLDRSKKTITQKNCTLTILGLHAHARWRSRQNCWKNVGFTATGAGTGGSWPTNHTFRYVLSVFWKC